MTMSSEESETKSQRVRAVYHEVNHDETEARKERRERRFRNIADPTVKEAKRLLKKRSRKLREEERLARKRWDEEDAETYRVAANAIENAIAELEDV